MVGIYSEEFSFVNLNDDMNECVVIHKIQFTKTLLKLPFLIFTIFYSTLLNLCRSTKRIWSLGNCRAYCWTNLCNLHISRNVFLLPLAKEK